MNEDEIAAATITNVGINWKVTASIAWNEVCVLYRSEWLLGGCRPKGSEELTGQ